ncbi:MAG: ABC transporter permease [Sellimonas intestinalis]
MRNYIIKRFLQLIPVLILVSIFSFLIIHAAPGDPIQNYVKPGMSEEQIQTIREEYGVDGNIVKQYVAWVGHVVRGDLGTSIYKNRPVTELLAEKLPATLILMGAAGFLSRCFVSIPAWALGGAEKE